MNILGQIIIVKKTDNVDYLEMIKKETIGEVALLVDDELFELVENYAMEPMWRYEVASFKEKGIKTLIMPSNTLRHILQEFSMQKKLCQTSIPQVG